MVTPSEGPDPDLKAIALYKLGWARFEDDMFPAAADAFGQLMDHGVPDGSDRAPQDLTAEAEEYLVRSLVRAGGAPAFRDHFERHGDRDYASRTSFMTWAALDRRFSLYAEAVACDELWLERYGNDPRALEVAERLVDSHQRSGTARCRPGRPADPGAAIPGRQLLAPGQRGPGTAHRRPDLRPGGLPNRGDPIPSKSARNGRRRTTGRRPSATTKPGWATGPTTRPLPAFTTRPVKPRRA